MTREEFKARWESSENGGGINFDDVAACAYEWGLSCSPKAKDMYSVLYRVLKAADVVDAEEYLPDYDE